MKLVIKFIFLVVFSCSSAIAQTYEEHWKTDLRVAFFGDDYTSGVDLGKYRDFAPTLERKLWDKKYTNFVFYKEGVAFETTEDAIKRLESIIRLEPHIVVLQFGINDVIQEVPLKTVYDNLNSIIRQLKKNKIDVLLIGMDLPKQLKQGDYVKFASMYKYLAKEHGLLLYPDFLKVIRGNKELHGLHSLHPNQNGVEAISEDFIPYIEKSIKIVRAKKNKKL